jgi:hypothetical protein
MINIQYSNALNIRAKTKSWKFKQWASLKNFHFPARIRTRHFFNEINTLPTKPPRPRAAKSKKLAYTLDKILPYYSFYASINTHSFPF